MGTLLCIPFMAWVNIASTLRRSRPWGTLILGTPNLPRVGAKLYERTLEKA
ncbi:MAG: hypothetical protein HZB26_09410 [Candidatus Hydrogenedentes bacterium]|nr:hypothetical protein [Candidatus Hydrogenedentota bacterium]